MTSKLFESILIANRGEIACRIIATCRRLGVGTIAVYSDADASSRHVRLADQAIHIGPAAARESYINIERILEAANKAGANAIHPGYGFLSENDAFADACASAGIVFIGPPAAAIRAMGSKSAAKALMREAGVPITPGYDGPDQDVELLRRQAGAVGYPIMIKASAGGGGKGMRRVDAREQFASALASCKREAATAFGSDAVLLEKYVVAPRHVEVQVFGDTSGNIVSLFERDCSVQRRHQKVIEEAPAPSITLAQREALGKAARDAARAAGYVNAGTVEFLFDRDGHFYFMEMNTRLQVEHPVTEMITGLDLVEWQLRVAAGESLPLSQDQLTLRGHAIEARVYAEDPDHDFLPSIGKLVHLQAPEQSGHVRIDTGVEQGDTITPYYDPMIAKLIVWDESRELALKRMATALSAYQLVGVANNISFLHRLVTSPSFMAANLDTGLIEREHAWLWPPGVQLSETALIFASLGSLLREHEGSCGGNSPWAMRDGWRLNATYKRAFVFIHSEVKYAVGVEYRAKDFRVSIQDRDYSVQAEALGHGVISAAIDGLRMQGTVIVDRGSLYVFIAGKTYILELIDPLEISAEGHSKESSLLAPMPGRVIAQLVETGEAVEKGAPLLVLEAMKMECTIHAPANGKVQAFHFAVGDQVAEGVELLHFDREETASGGD
ncbi:MAG TPA: acetyl/propionyl/methylcrotonyl-CoA carboxylase subunit alpha [Terracidiphilus sp.]|jgi:3-methylcrotonyl-CoA carboxylase alpha subunit